MGTLKEFGRAAAGQGLTFGLLMGGWRYIDTGRIGSAVIGGLISGIWFGVLMGWWTVRQRRRASAELGGLFERRSNTELRRGLRRPEEADPELQADLRQLLRHRLAAWDRQTIWPWVVLGGFAVGTVVLAFTRSAWWWPVVALWAYILWRAANEGKQLRRRLDRLEERHQIEKDTRI